VHVFNFGIILTYNGILVNVNRHLIPVGTV